jgi:hypothetical protein
LKAPFTPMVIVDSAIAGEAVTVKHRLEELIQNIDKNTFDIAELLYTIKKKGYYAPFNTFQEFRRSLKLKPRKSQYLTRIAGVMEEVGIPRSQYEPLGIARLRDIASLEPTEIWTNPVSLQSTPMREFIKGFVDYREDDGGYIDPEKLKINIRTLKGLVGENDFDWLHLYMKRSVIDNTARPALELMKAHIGSVGKDEEGISQDASDSRAAELIFADYLVDPANGLDTLYAASEDVESEEVYEDLIEGPNESSNSRNN